MDFVCHDDSSGDDGDKESLPSTECDFNKTMVKKIVGFFRHENPIRKRKNDVSNVPVDPR